MGISPGHSHIYRMPLLKIVTFCLLALLVVGGHVALWLSPDWPTDLKVKLTILNAIGWAVVVLPAFAVARWAAAHRGQDDTQ